MLDSTSGPGFHLMVPFITSFQSVQVCNSKLCAGIYKLQVRDGLAGVVLGFTSWFPSSHPFRACRYVIVSCVLVSTSYKLEMG